MAQKTTAIVSNVLPKGAAFAMHVDTDESIYIPAKVAHRMSLSVMDEITVLLIPNEIQPEKTPWFCISVVPGDVYAK